MISLLEETLLAILLGLMTLITFANVIVRYIFTQEWFAPIREALSLPTNLLWGLEATVFLFAWMVLLGASYCVKVNAHLGVDVVLKSVPSGVRPLLTTLAVLCCLAFALLLFVGGWNYWAPFAGFPPIPNLWNDWIAGPLGLPEVANRWRDQGWYEVNDIKMPDWLRFIEARFNAGESYEYIPKFIPYFILPLSMGLLVLRFIQAGWKIASGHQAMLIASHEAEDDIEDAAARAAGERQ